MWTTPRLMHRGTGLVSVSRLLCAKATTGTASTSTSDYQAREAHEKEEDKQLDDEEFNVLDEEKAVGGDAFMPLSHRLAIKADALEQEMDRIHWSLHVRRQLVVDTTAATVTGRPARVDKVFTQFLHNAQTNNSNSSSTTTTTTTATTAESPNAAHTATPRARRESASSPSSASASARTAAWAAMDSAPYTHWAGSPSPLVQLYGRLRGLAPQRASETTTDLATLSADLDYLRRGRALHALHYYHRLNFTPKRHIWHALFHVVWNLWVATRNACAAIVYGTFRGVRDGVVRRGLSPTSACLLGAPIGFLQGTRLALRYLWYGWLLSPWIHVTRGLWNTCYGPVSFFTGTYMFDALSGRWMLCSANDAKLFGHALQLEKRLIRTIGRATYTRAKNHRESKWGTRLASMGFSMQDLRQKIQTKTKSGKAQQSHYTREDSKRRGAAGEDVQDPYEVLGVRRTATQQHIKEQYKKLAKVFHPDVAASQHGGPLSVEEKEKMQNKFAGISNAYQVLSNPEKKKAYDMGGAQGLHMHETKYGTFLSRTPEEMVQSIFGGEGFRRLLIGELLRSHWDLKNEAQVSVSLQDFEELQCIRTRQLSAILAEMLDVHAQKPSVGAYHRHTGAGSARGGGGGGGGASSVQRPVRLSGLPDPFGGRPSGSRATSAQAKGGRGAVLGGQADLHKAVLTELGDTSSTSAASASGGSGSSGGRTRLSAAGTTAEAVMAAAAAAEAARLSPYTLHPGTNEFNNFSREFEERCAMFVAKLHDACFGPELLYEVGEAYVIGAQRFLGVRPFYAPKVLVQRKVMSGIGRVWSAFVAQMKSPEGVDNKTGSDELARKVMLEYFNLEFDNIVADMHVVLRYTVQNALQDATESELVRKKRCYALWLLGEKMKEKGRPWSNNRNKDDAELIAYIQQAANSASTTSRNIAF